MTNFYTYLISSLPSLQFGTKLPFSFEKFLELCQRFIPDDDLEILKNVSITGDYPSEISQLALKNWYDFDTQLRNELVKIRATQRHLDAAKFLRQEKFAELSLTHLAMSATRATSILEAQKLLDAGRWRALDNFSFGHYFDLDFLIIYALKLLILERWGKINTADKSKILEGVL